MSQSPAALTARRFFRNRLALSGLVILAFLLFFSFLGGAVMPYRQDQVFYREDVQRKPYAAVSEFSGYRLTPAPGHTADPVLEAQLSLALRSGETDFSYGDNHYRLERHSDLLYRVYTPEDLWGIAHSLLPDWEADFLLLHGALTAYAEGQTVFSVREQDYEVDENGFVSLSGTPLGQLSRLVVRPITEGESLSQEFREAVTLAISENSGAFTFRDREFSLSYDGGSRLWSVQEQTRTRVWDSYSPPSRQHPLGTDKNGMDMLTRLMYGGRVSLVIGFIVVLIAGLLGVVLGGISGYFGGWADEAVMRLVDIFYCIPSTPMLIILGAAMDALRVAAPLRMLTLMLVLGLLGWPPIARLVRGQLLSLREQEFMTAAEAAGLGAGRRIFHHLLPNVIPQLIVSCTLRLGSTILTEATLSFLGLGVKFPFASWGNIMNDVGNIHVLTSYWFVWIPAGVCLVLAVLGFNFVGDGLRDAFDPKMKR